jgi:hypothetical protein
VIAVSAFIVDAKGSRVVPVKEKLDQLRTELDAFAEQCPKVSEDNLFVTWFLRAYLTENDEDAIKAVSGASGDKGIDGILTDNSARVVYVIQAKYRRARFEKPEPRSGVIDFAAIAQTIYDPDNNTFGEFLKGMDAVAAEMLRDARRRILKDGFRGVLIFVTLGRCSTSLERDARQTVRRASPECSIELLDGRRCLVLLQDYLDGAAPPIPTLDVPIESSRGVKVNGVLQRYDTENRMESWVFSSKGDSIASMFEIGGRRLFARNIRGFLGEGTPVNESMAETLRTQPEYFFYYNNGITIICDRAEKISHKGTDVMRVSNPQVINGQQTSRVLSEAAHSQDASVLVKIIQVPRDPLKTDSHFEGLVGRIVQATNWQNAIRPADLMANDRRQLDIEKELRHHGYFYARKRQTKSEIRAQMRGKKYVVISKEELAQAVAGCELDPVVARSGKDNLFVEEKYKDVFPNASADYYLPRYWLFRQVTRGARGAPQRGYTKWMVLGYLWDHLAGDLRGSRAARRFSELCRKEEPSLDRSLGSFINSVYVQAIAYYRANRGKGDAEVDISLFFRNKKGRHKEFREFWGRLPASKLKAFSKSLGRVRKVIGDAA